MTIEDAKKLKEQLLKVESAGRYLRDLLRDNCPHEWRPFNSDHDGYGDCCDTCGAVK